MKSALLPLIVSAFLWTTVIAGLIPRQTPCTVTKLDKTIKWGFYLSGGRNPAPPVQQYDLTAPGRGFAWREAYGPNAAVDDHVTKPILFGNDQGWKVINCSWYFPAEDPDRDSCTSPEFALFNEGTSGKGKMGTIIDLTYPAIFYWAVYDLIEFRLTPIVPTDNYQDMVTVEVFGWKEDGSQTNTMSFQIKGSEVGYKVSLPKGGWDAIVMWQVHVGGYPFVIDDMVIEEYAVNPDEVDCANPIQTPTSTPPLEILKFDDIDANPSAPLPTPYKSYTFNSAWSVNKLDPTTSSPNALHAGPFTDPTARAAQILALDFMWDADSFQLTLESTQNLADLDIWIQGYGPCFDIFRQSGIVGGSYMSIKPTEYSFNVDLKSIGFRKQRALEISVYNNALGQRVPFWVDDLVVRSWQGQFGGLPGCERGGKFIGWHYEYPRMVR